MAVETEEERAAREAAEAEEEERRREIEEAISRLEGDIATAEENIRQLTALNANCSNYQAEFESGRAMRENRLEEFEQIPGQEKLVGVYGGMMEELLNGLPYTGTYGSMDEAKAEISREIERQRQTIDECCSRITGLRMEL